MRVTIVFFNANLHFSKQPSQQGPLATAFQPALSGSPLFKLLALPEVMTLVRRVLRGGAEDNGNNLSSGLSLTRLHSRSGTLEWDLARSSRSSASLRSSALLATTKKEYEKIPLKEPKIQRRYQYHIINTLSPTLGCWSQPKDAERRNRLCPMGRGIIWGGKA
jgi:hypothetical protein